MRKLKFVYGMLLTICISLIHIHCSLYTVGNMLNPVTFVGLLMKGEETFFLFTGYTAQFLVTMLAAIFILRFQRWLVWLIVYIIGVLISFWLNMHNPLSHFSFFQYSGIAKCYDDFYGYELALLWGTYYVALQAFVFSLYVFITYLLKAPFIERILTGVANFMCYKYNAFIHSALYEKMNRNKYVLGTVVLMIILCCMIVYVLSHFDNYIKNEVMGKEARTYEITNGNDEKIDAHFNEMFNSSDVKPSEGKYENTDNAKVIDTYDLWDNNCTTKSVEAVKIGTDGKLDLNSSSPSDIDTKLYYQNKKKDGQVERIDIQRLNEEYKLY